MLIQSLVRHLWKSLLTLIILLEFTKTSGMKDILFYDEAASSSLEACLSLKKIHATGLHNEKLSSYTRIIHFLHTASATNDIIAHAIKELESYKQRSEVAVALYAKWLYTKTPRHYAAG